MSGPCTLTPLVISSTVAAVSASAPSGASVSSPKLPVRPSLSGLSIPQRLSRSYLYYLYCKVCLRVLHVSCQRSLTLLALPSSPSHLFCPSPSFPWICLDIVLQLHLVIFLWFLLSFFFTLVPVFISDDDDDGDDDYMYWLNVYVQLDPLLLSEFIPA